MSLTTEDGNFEHKEFNERFVRCSEPILIGDESLTEEENKILRDRGYPDGYVELLDNIFLPVEWEETGQTWRRVVSTESPNRKELFELENDLSSRMEYWQVSDQGMCPIKRELYFRYFDELIRQVCILNNDLGELLIRIRDEFRVVIESYKNIYEDTHVTSIAEKVMAKDGQGMNDLQNYLKSLETENVLSENMLSDANRKLQNLKENFSDELHTLKASNENELIFFNKNHEAINEQYSMLLAATGPPIDQENIKNPSK